MIKILITGASGFIGQSLSKVLLDNGYEVRGTYNNNWKENIDKIDWIKCDLNQINENISSILSGIDIVIHLAGIAHVFKSSKHNQEYIELINSTGTQRLAQKAALNGVKKFIYLSTVKVHGEQTIQNDNGNYQYLTEQSKCTARDPYSKSKIMAENYLSEICKITSMEYVILRPSIIYGPGVKANFLNLIKLVDKIKILPFASIHNKRSFLYVGNLCDAIVNCIENPISGNKVYLISDSEFSLPELVSKIAMALNKKIILMPCPILILKIIGVLTGKNKSISTITSSLLLNNKKISRELNWTPKYSTQQGIAMTVKWYKQNYVL